MTGDDVSSDAKAGEPQPSCLLTLFRRFRKLAVWVGGAAGIVTIIGFLTTRDRNPWDIVTGAFGFALGGFLIGALACALALAGQMAGHWVHEGFQRGVGFRRVAIPVAILSALVLLGFFFGVDRGLGLGSVVACIWFLCCIRRDLGWRTLAYRVGLFAGATAGLIVLAVVQHGRDNATLRDEDAWAILVALCTGVAAWAITLTVRKVRGHSAKG